MLIVTSLAVDVAPLIRSRIGDLICFTRTRGSTQRHLPVAGAVRGACVGAVQAIRRRREADVPNKISRVAQH